jgi:trimeric autotransporter adhesin
MNTPAYSRTKKQHQSEQSFSDLNIQINQKKFGIKKVRNLRKPKLTVHHTNPSGKFISGKSLVIAIGSLAIPLMTNISAQAAPLTCSSIYADVNGGTQIYSINTTTAAITAAATLPVASNVGMTLIPGATPTLYSDSVGTIHLTSTNGSTTSNNTTATFSSTYGGGLGADSSGRLFYIAKTGTAQHLWRFNTTTSPAVDMGTITGPVGDTIWPKMSPGDMMSDANGRLYYFGSDYTLASGLYTNYLYYVDANMNAHRLGSYKFTQVGIGVAFDPSGIIYTLNGSFLYKIDLTTGFSATLVGNTGNSTLIDIGSCALPTMNPNVSATKTVQNTITSQNPATIVNTNEILQYNITVSNTGNLPSDTTKFIDTIPAGSTYITGSTQLCNAAGAACTTITDVSSVAPFVGAGALVNTAGQGAGVLLPGATNNAVIKFQVKVISTGIPGTIINTGQVSYPTVAAGLPTTNIVNTTTTSVPVNFTAISGKVFEDMNYGGGAGRDYTTSGSNGRPNVRVELYSSTGSFLSTTTTDASGYYNFPVSLSTSYTVRVVNSSVSSARSGYTNSLIPVQTFRTNGLTTNIGTPDPNRVGGESPQLTDAGNGSTSLAALNTSTTTAQSITIVSVGAASVTGSDFGYNFDTIINTNDAGQGSLRQFILNSNALLNTNLDQVPNPNPALGTTAVDPAAGEEASIFMISDGLVHPGLRAGLSNLLTSGVAEIIPTTPLPVINDVGTSIDGRTQTANVGNTKTGSTGYSSTVGVPASTSLSGVPNPEVQISNNQTQSQGLNVTGNNFAARGISIYGFGNVGIDNNANILLNGSSNSVIEKSLIGTASGAVLNTIPTTGNGVRHGIAITNSATNITIQDNAIAENGVSGIYLNDASPNVYSNITIQRNEAAFNGVTDPSSGDGFTLANCTSGCTAQNNYIHDNQAYGIQDYQNQSLNITTNTINNNGVGSTETAGIMVWGSTGTQIFQNIISLNTGDGIYLARHPYVATQPLANQIKISQNSLFGNGQLGIDLAGPSTNPTIGYRTGQTPYVTANDGITGNTVSNNGMDYPVITDSTLIAGNLQVKGFVGNMLTSTTFSGAKLEFFIADNSPANQYGEVILNDGKSKSHGEGRTYLGTCVADGNSQFNCSFPTAGALGLTSAINITATAIDGNGNTSEFSAVPSTRASLLLVKRITAVTDGVTNTTTKFSGFVDDPSTLNDNHSGWPNGYLLGSIDGGIVKPGDELEYTIYFLNGGENRIAQARVCDRLNADLIFQPQFDISATSNQGILFAQGISSQYLTNISDSDRGLLSSSSIMPLNCNIASNSTINLSNNVVVVDVATSSNPLLSGERGYVKFKVKVRQ